MAGTFSLSEPTIDPPKGPPLPQGPKGSGVLVSGLSLNAPHGFLDPLACPPQAADIIKRHQIAQPVIFLSSEDHTAIHLFTDLASKLRLKVVYCPYPRPAMNCGGFDPDRLAVRALKQRIVDIDPDEAYDARASRAWATAPTCATTARPTAWTSRPSRF